MVFTLNSPALDFLSEVIGVEGSGGVSRSALEKYRPRSDPPPKIPYFDSLLSGNAWVFVMSAIPRTQDTRPCTRSLGFDDFAQEMINSKLESTAYAR
jgi:hypothetical protein